MTFRPFAIPLIALVLAACNAQKPTAPDKTTTAPANAPQPKPAPAPAPAASAKPRAIAEKSATFEFDYTWPAEAAAIPALNRWLESNAASLRAYHARDARSDAKLAKAQDYVFNAHSYTEHYEVVADTPRLLVLLSEGYIYTGGAHGMPINTGVIWDRQAGRRLSTWSIFDKTALSRLLVRGFCAELDRQRAEKRGGPVNHDDPDQIDEFVNCVPVSDRLILPVAAKRGGAIDTIRLIIPPYEAGPYSEGTYVIDLPITDAVLAAAKPEWRGAFTVRK